jgi:hypothetical protein
VKTHTIQTKNKNMDILTLAKKVDKTEFKEALDYIKEVNDAGLLGDFFDLVMEMEREDRYIMSCIHSAYYDLLIDSDTGKYKAEVKNLVTGSGGNYGF